VTRAAALVVSAARPLRSLFAALVVAPARLLRLLFVLLALAAATFFVAPAPLQAGIRVEAPDALAGERRDVEREIERSLPLIVEFFGDTLAADYTIAMTRTAAEFVSATGGRAPAWAIGVAIPSERRVVLLSERMAPPGTRAGRVAVHEIVHLFVAEASAGRAPRWLDEGIAVYISGEDRGASIYDLARAIFTENVLFLDEISRRFPESDASARLAYYESLTAVQFIARNWGAASLRDLLEATALYGYDDAMRTVFGLSADELEFEWYRDLRRRTRWVGWVGDGLPFAMLMTLLVLAAWLRKRIISQRRLARWAEEEAQAEAAPLARESLPAQPRAPNAEAPAPQENARPDDRSHVK
jgi:hypothetical protein